MTQIVIGIDPGLGGALACLSDKNALISDMPTVARGAGTGRVKREVDAAGVAAILRGYTAGMRDDAIVVLERVAAMPGQGVASMLSIGDSLGTVRGVVAALGLPLVWVTSQKWKKHYGLGREKELARARAIQLYPTAELNLHKHHGRAEALLIARWGWEELR